MSIRPRPSRCISREPVRKRQRSNCALNLNSSHPTVAQPKGDFAMRFMVIVKATPESEKEGFLPDPELMAEMSKFNEELIKAGVVLAMDGLQPSSKGARVKFSGKSRTVMAGP